MIERKEVAKAISHLDALNHVAEAALLTGLLYVGDQVSALRDDLEQHHQEIRATSVEYIGYPGGAKGGTWTVGRPDGARSDAIPYDAGYERIARAAFHEAMLTGDQAKVTEAVRREVRAKIYPPTVAEVMAPEEGEK